MTHEVFISYASEDKSVADEVRWHLEENDIGCWIAPRDIRPGMEYAEAIVDAIDKSEAMVLVFSTHANGSPQVRREVERAVSKDIPIIPFRIEDIAPTDSMEYYISSPHWLNAFSPPLSEHLEELVDAVRNLLQKTRIPEEISRKEIAEVQQLPSIQEKEFHRRQLIKATNLYTLGESREALGECKELIESCKRTGDVSGAAEALNLKARISIELNEIDSASEDISEALELTKSLDTGVWEDSIQDLIGESNVVLGIISSKEGKWKDSMKFLGKAKKIFSKTKNHKAYAECQIQAGQILQAQGEFKDAKKRYEDALNKSKMIGDKLGEATYMGLLGELVLNMGKPKDAIRHFERVRNISDLLEEKSITIKSLYNLGTGYLRLGKFKEALRNAQESIDLSQRQRYALGEADGLRLMSDIMRAQGKSNKATKYLEESLEIKRKLRDYGD